MRINHLWQKLALGFIAVALSAIVVSYFLVNFVIDLRFAGYIGDRERATYRRVGQSLASEYVKNNGWTERMSESLPHLAMMSGVAVEVVDGDGRVIADTSSEKTGDSMMEHMSRMIGNGNRVTELLRERMEVPILAYDKRIGTVFVTPLVKAGQLEADTRFRQSINSSLIFGGLLAGLVALSLSFYISTRLTRPLGQMTKAAKIMEGGDLAQRVNIEGDDEIGQLGEALNHLALALQRQERLRKNLTADIAHELRTPLATIRSHIEACLDGVMKPDKKNLESIQEEILRLGRLVDDLGELARAESGKFGLNKDEVDVSALVEKTAQGLKPLFQSEKVALKVAARGRVVGEFDEDKLKQVLVNLLVNAVKFTPAGGEVIVSVDADREKIRIAVADSGVGIDDQSLPYIFERFYRVEKSRNRATGGSGIGLTIAKKMVELHGGVIEVTSKLGKGTTFTVTLPKMG